VQQIAAAPDDRRRTSWQWLPAVGAQTYAGRHRWCHDVTKSEGAGWRGGDTSDTAGLDREQAVCRLEVLDSRLPSILNIGLRMGLDAATNDEGRDDR
jgi:hypothetical protein